MTDDEKAHAGHIGWECPAIDDPDARNPLACPACRLLVEMDRLREHVAELEADAVALSRALQDARLPALAAAQRISQVTEGLLVRYGATEAPTMAERLPGSDPPTWCPRRGRVAVRNKLAAENERLRYEREPSQAEGDAAEGGPPNNVAGECWIAPWTGRRCRHCSRWVWGGPTACVGCAERSDENAHRIKAPTCGECPWRGVQLHECETAHPLPCAHAVCDHPACDRSCPTDAAPYAGDPPTWCPRRGRNTIVEALPVLDDDNATEER